MKLRQERRFFGEKAAFARSLEQKGLVLTEDKLQRRIRYLFGLTDDLQRNATVDNAHRVEGYNWNVYREITHRVAFWETLISRGLIDRYAQATDFVARKISKVQTKTTEDAMRVFCYADNCFALGNLVKMMAGESSFEATENFFAAVKNQLRWIRRQRELGRLRNVNG